MKICLNSIVKNEGARILRALDSLKPYIETFAVLDTGSTDNTVELIREWGEKNNIPGVVGLGAFTHYSQARNDALKLGHSWCRGHRADYLLLMDADMELVVTDHQAFMGLDGEMYQMAQKAGTTHYFNARLLRAGSKATYVGRTHEYLQAQPSGQVEGAYFVDHADGANRPGKYARDIELLLADISDYPENSRSWYYLANTYRDKGDFALAADAYRRRIEIGGWDEETWSARIGLANMMEKQGLEDAFIKEALLAYESRPQRAETLYGLSKHFREKGHNKIACLFASKGLDTPRPNDLLFLDDWVYDWGCREEFSIVGFYGSEADRKRGYYVTNELALDKKIPDHNRTLARSNMRFYLPKITEFAPRASFHEVGFKPRDGYTAMNPCITNRPSGALELLLRTVNYKIDPHGRYMIGPTQCGDAPIVTENHLLQIDNDTLHTTSSVPVIWERPAPVFPLVVGLEDMRIFWHKGQRRFNACVREQSERGICDQYYGTLDSEAMVSDYGPISNGVDHEKNWGAWTAGAVLKYVYRLDKMQLMTRQEKVERSFACDNISGGSPWIDFEFGKLSIVHEAIPDGTGRRVYQHRFALASRDFTHMRVSLPFVFEDVQIEFAVGLALTDTDVIVSYGVRDEKAMLVKISRMDVQRMVRV